MSKTYEAPAVRTVGTVHDLTLQEQDKIGTSSDAVTELAASQGLTLTGKIQDDPNRR